MAWNNFRGAYSNTGQYQNVVIGGNPSNTGDFGVPLATAHGSGYGYGIQFTTTGYKVKFELNLIGYAVTDGGVYQANMAYVPFGGMYNYFLKVSVSNNGGSTYRDISNSRIFSHGDSWSLAYRSGWETTAKNSQWSGSFDIPTDTTHVKVELYGEDTTFPYSNVYPIDVVIPNFRPFAVYRSGVEQSCNRNGGELKILRNGSIVDIEKMNISDQAKENSGSCRIIKNGKQIGQSKIGKE